MGSVAMRLVLFDLDETLVDSRRSMTAAFVEEGLESPAPEATASVVGMSLENGIRTPAPGLDSARAAAAPGRDGIGGRFVTVRTGDGGPSQPHPDVVLRGLHDTGVDARRAVTVGDATYDIFAAAAAAAGVGAVGVTWGFQTRAELEEAGADVVVDAAGEVVPAIPRLLDEREGAAA